MSRCTAEQKLLMKKWKNNPFIFLFRSNCFHSIRKSFGSVCPVFFINGEGVSNHMAILHLLLVKWGNAHSQNYFKKWISNPRPRTTIHCHDLFSLLVYHGAQLFAVESHGGYDYVTESCFGVFRVIDLDLDLI